MKRLIAESYLLLVRVDLLMIFGGVQEVHRCVRECKVQDARVRIVPSVLNLCRAMNLACVFYIRNVLCLQRSAATTLLLRRYGHNAELVIGAQVLPFKSHAWVEADGAIVNDKPYVADIYHVLERC
jgi:hypothetical protein